MSSSDDWQVPALAGAVAFTALVLWALWYPWQVPSTWTGVEPEAITGWSCGPADSRGGIECTPAGTDAFSWSLPAGTGVTSEAGLVWLGSPRAFSAVAGALELEDTGDCPATVEWRLAVRDAAGTTTPVAEGLLASSATRTPDDDRPLAGPARRLQVSLRRTDDLGCAATVYWRGPALRRRD